MPTSPYCAGEAPVRINSLCPTEAPNRIVATAFAHKSATITETTAAALITALLAAEKTCDAFILRNVNGTYDGGSYTEGTGRGMQVSRVTGGSHTATITDFEAVDNVDFWNNFRDRAIDYNVYFFTSNLILKVTGKQISALPSLPITEDIQTEITGTAVIKWSDKNIPSLLVSDTETIKGLQLLPDLGAATITNFGAGSATVTGTEVSIGAADTLEIDIAFADGATSYALDDEAEAAGLTINPTNGQVTGTHTGGEGVYTITVTGTNDCGISGGVDITLEVTA